MNRVLVANRGEIAVRAIYALKELGLETVAVYSEADGESLHVQLADIAIKIGPPSPAESYLNVHRILSAAEVSGADAVYPGYGFLSESPQFARICEQHGLLFIGPSPDTMEAMADKVAARRLMADAGVQTVPGSEGAVGTLAEARATAESVGYPVIVKAAFGGGGRGMRLVRRPADLERGFQAARSEARIAFDDDTVYVEKFLSAGRHLEVQVLGDGKGGVIHLYERDCSTQRRHQKLIEEAPAPNITPAERQTIVDFALRGARAINYRSAGTLEFMYTDGRFYFMEMNTRLQVEHPVTEEVTSFDIVKEQLRLARGEKLPLQESVSLRGCAIECRINAEDPEQDFLPCPGEIKFLHKPGGPGIRVDSSVYQGCRIPSNYDSLIAKLIARGADREEAIARATRALEEMSIGGVKTTIDLVRSVLVDEEFRAGRTSTALLEKILA